MVHDSEREDFEQAIRSKGFDLDDFELVEQQDPMEGRPQQRCLRVRKRVSTAVAELHRYAASICLD